MLHKSNNNASAGACAAEVLDGIFPVVQFIRHVAQGRKMPGLSVQRVRAMAYIRRRPGDSLSRLAEYLALSVPAASRLIEVLVVRGLAQRQPLPDNRRKVQLTISPRGNKLLDDAIAGTLQELELRLRRLNADQRKRIIQAVRDLRLLFEPALED
jgi:DNA-binding MarR family transcriptional regulator